MNSGDFIHAMSPRQDQDVPVTWVTHVTCCAVAIKKAVPGSACYSRAAYLTQNTTEVEDAIVSCHVRRTWSAGSFYFFWSLSFF